VSPSPRSALLDQEVEEAQQRKSRDESPDDGLRHIVCFLCFPLFEGTRSAPHDAQCICGRPIKAGATAGPAEAPECVMCNEMAQPHYRFNHAED